MLVASNFMCYLMLSRSLILGNRFHQSSMPMRLGHFMGGKRKGLGLDLGNGSQMPKSLNLMLNIDGMILHLYVNLL
jgi:hypothetical protein